MLEISKILDQAICGHCGKFLDFKETKKASVKVNALHNSESVQLIMSYMGL
jgi:hypothetical protein